MSNRELIILLINYLLEKYKDSSTKQDFGQKLGDKDFDFFEEELPTPKPSKEAFSYSNFSIFSEKNTEGKQSTQDNLSNDFADFDFDSF